MLLTLGSVARAGWVHADNDFNAINTISIHTMYGRVFPLFTVSLFVCNCLLNVFDEWWMLICYMISSVCLTYVLFMYGQLHPLRWHYEICTVLGGRTQFTQKLKELTTHSF